MMHNCQRLVVALSMMVLVSGLVSAQEGGEVDKLKAIDIRLEQMTKALEKDFKRVADDLAAIRKDFNAAVADSNLKTQDAQNRLTQLEKQVIQLRNELDAAQKRVSLYPPNNKPQTSYYPATVGTLVIENRYSEPVLFVLGSARYRVDPFTSRQIEGVPLGPVTYEVISSWGVQQRSGTVRAETPLRINVQ